ncbi:MAG TPA: hypothetical protein VMH26_12970 [Burkholderiales bacterium]|nr:hypothetical protein [Burkholderiales bacterium]
MLDLHGEIGSVQGIEAADATFDIDSQVAQRGLDRRADVSPRGERIQGPQLAAHRGRELVEPAFPGDGEQAIGTGADAQRLDQRYPVRLASLAIGDPDVADLAAPDDERHRGGALGERLRDRRGRARLAEHPVAFAVGVRFEQDGDVAQFERADVDRSRDQRPEADLHRHAPDLDHLRLRAPVRVSKPHTLGNHRDRGKHLELERPVDGERSPEQLRDEGLDAALVLAQVAEGEVKHDRDEQGSHGGKDDGGEAAK